jgi:SAM-dependent methyltransferase
MTSTTYVAQISPQRSTQYTNVARDLAAAELLASPLGQALADVAMEQIAGQDYLKFTVTGASLSPEQLEQIAGMAMLGSLFEFFPVIGDVEGPLLRPTSAVYPYFISADLASIRRYKGKTNEFFTRFLLNIAKNASDFRDTEWRDLKMLDPLCGGGTTLFAALSLGAHVAGIELDRGDVESTATFLTQFCRESRIQISVTEERLRKLASARRWLFLIGKKENQRRCMLANGDAVQARELTSGFGQPHLIVTDLPYGIQHQAPLSALLTARLPAWAELLQPGGAIAFSWDATRFSRAEMVEFVEQVAPLDVVQRPPYDAIAHRVDRVVKRRDVIVTKARP